MHEWVHGQMACADGWVNVLSKFMNLCGYYIRIILILTVYYQCIHMYSTYTYSILYVYALYTYYTVYTYVQLATVYVM